MAQRINNNGTYKLSWIKQKVYQTLWTETKPVSEGNVCL